MKLYVSSYYHTLAIILLTTLFTSSKTKKAAKGPFRVTVLSINNTCTEKPLKPYEKNPSAVFNFYIHDTKYVGGNVTIFKSNKNLRGNVKATLMKNGKREIIAIINNVTCRSVIIASVIAILGHNVTNVLCNMPKGSYNFRGLDLNKLEHLLKKNLEYGLMTSRVEAVTPKETVACTEVVALVAPPPRLLNNK